MQNSGQSFWTEELYSKLKAQFRHETSDKSPCNPDLDKQPKPDMQQLYQACNRYMSKPNIHKVQNKVQNVQNVKNPEVQVHMQT